MFRRWFSGKITIDCSEDGSREITDCSEDGSGKIKDCSEDGFQVR